MQKLSDTDNSDYKASLLQALNNGSVISWQHINMLGEYDFSEEKLQDTVGIKPPKNGYHDEVKSWEYDFCTTP